MIIGSHLPAIGLAHFSALSLMPIELVALAAKTGFRHVGLRLHPVAPGGQFYELAPGTAGSREFVSLLHGEGMTVYDIETVVIDSSFSPSSLEPVLAAAWTIGAKRLDACGDDPDRSRLIDNLGALCDLAAGYEISVDVENMGWRTVAAFADCVALIVDCGRSNAGVLVDTLHFSRNGAAPSDLRSVNANLIASAQLCDARIITPQTPEEMIREARSERLPPGDGALPNVAIVRELPEGVILSVEVPNKDPLRVEEHIKELFVATTRVLREAAQGGE